MPSPSSSFPLANPSAVASGSRGRAPVGACADMAGGVAILGRPRRTLARTSPGGRGVAGLAAQSPASSPATGHPVAGVGRPQAPPVREQEVEAPAKAYFPVYAFAIRKRTPVKGTFQPSSSAACSYSPHAQWIANRRLEELQTELQTAILRRAVTFEP